MNEAVFKQNLNNSCFENNSVSPLEQIRETLNEFESNCAQSKRLETSLKVAFAEQSENTKHLQEILERQRERNGKLIELMKGVDSSLETSPRTTCSSTSVYAANDRYSFDTISPVLMQYRYDELALSHRNCLKQLWKKDRILKDVLIEKELVQTKHENLIQQHNNLRKKTEMLCCKYLALRAKKTEEILNLRELLIYAAKQSNQLMENDGNGNNYENVQNFLSNINYLKKIPQKCSESI